MSTETYKRDLLVSKETCLDSNIFKVRIETYQCRKRAREGLALVYEMRLPY